MLRPLAVIMTELENLVTSAKAEMVPNSTEWTNRDHSLVERMGELKREFEAHSEEIPDGSPIAIRYNAFIQSLIDWADELGYSVEETRNGESS